MKNFLVLLDIVTKLIEYAFKIVIYILFKFGSNRSTVSYGCHRTDRSKIKS